MICYNHRTNSLELSKVNRKYTNVISKLPYQLSRK